MPITMNLYHTADLALPLKKTRLQAVFLTGDDLSHCFQVDVCRDGEPVQLSGALVTGYFIRPDGATVSIPGLAEKSRVTLTLPASCYRLPGRFSLVIRLMQDNVKTSVFWAEGAMTLSATDTLVDDGVIPSLDDLLFQIEAMEKATAAANEAADTVMQKLHNGELNGRGLTILGYYESLNALNAAVSQPAAGDAYAIGTQAPYDTYIWNGTKNEWVNNGPLQGVPGKDGAPGRNGTNAQFNLLDNSNFSVAQAGYPGQHGSSWFVADRWYAETRPNAVMYASHFAFNANDGGSIVVHQKTTEDVANRLLGKMVTLAVCTSADEILCASGKVVYDTTVAGISYGDAWTLQLRFFQSSKSYQLARFEVKAGKTVNIKWVALYEGEYNTDTLPPYIPKGYAAELAACMRYFQLINVQAIASSYTTAMRYYPVHFPMVMRIAPTVTLTDYTEYKTMSVTGGEVTVNNVQSHMCRFQCSGAISDVNGGLWAMIKAQASADP